MTKGTPGPRAEVSLPRLGPLGWARWAWRQLTSMRTALLLLMLLAIAAVPGSVLPQRRIDPTRVDNYLTDHPASGPWLDRIGAFDVYSAPWFAAIYLLLFISLVGCVLPRSRQHWRAARAAPPRTPRRLERLPAHAEGTTDVAPAQVLERARTALRRRRYRVAGYDDSVAAERGYLAETGNLAFHLALLGVLAAIAAGSYLSWSGQTVVVEGTTFADTATRYDTLKPGRGVDVGGLPPFSFSLDSLRVRFETQAAGNQFGAAREFDADLTVRDAPDAPTYRRTVEVNRPLDVNGARVFLVGNGYAPIVTVRDAKGEVVASGPVPFIPQDGFYTSHGVVKAPDAQPKGIGVVGLLLPTAVVQANGQPESVFPDAKNPRLLITAYVGDLGIDDGRPQSVYILDTTKMTQVQQSAGQAFRAMLAPGDTVALPGGAGQVTFEGLRRYAAFDIRYDPTKGWALGFAAAALVGLTLSLFVRRRRVWVRAAVADDGRTVVQVAGLSRDDDARLPDEVAAVLADCVPAARDRAREPDEGSRQEPVASG